MHPDGLVRLFEEEIRYLLALERERAELFAYLASQADGSRLRKTLEDAAGASRKNAASLERTQTPVERADPPEAPRALGGIVEDHAVRLAGMENPRLRDALLLSCAQCLDSLTLSVYSTAVAYGRGLRRPIMTEQLSRKLAVLIERHLVAEVLAELELEDAIASTSPPRTSAWDRLRQLASSEKENHRS